MKRITRNAADKMSTKQLKRNLKAAKLPTKGNRDELISRYGKLIRGTLAEEGMSSPSEGDEGEDRAVDNPAVVMTDESTGNRYMRLVESKGSKEETADPWLIKDLHAELKAWGRPGGGDNKLVIKSDGESPIVAVREALARKHGGIISPEQPPKGEHASNGIVEEAGKTIRDMAKVLKLQLESNLGRMLHMKEPVMHWLIRWAAMALSRFQVGQRQENRLPKADRPSMQHRSRTIWRKYMVQEKPRNRP